MKVGQKRGRVGGEMRGVPANSCETAKLGPCQGSVAFVSWYEDKVPMQLRHLQKKSELMPMFCVCGIQYYKSFG